MCIILGPRKNQEHRLTLLGLDYESDYGPRRFRVRDLGVLLRSPLPLAWLNVHEATQVDYKD